MKDGKRFNPRGAQLLIVILVVLVANLLLTNSIIYVTIKNNLRNSIIKNELPLHSSWIYSEIKQELQPPLVAVASLAENFFLKKWLEEGEKEPELISQYLETIRKKYGGVTCFLVSEKTRLYYNMNGAFPVLEEDTDSQWYFNFYNSGEKSSINSSLNVDMNNMPTVFINHRILNEEGETLGVTGIGLALAKIPSILTQYSNDSDRDIYFVDSEGKIIARSSGSIINTSRLSDVASLRGSIKTILSNESSIKEFEIGDELLFMHSMYLPELHWWLLSVQRESVALSKMNRMIYSVITINIVTIIVTLLFVLFYVSFSQKRLKGMATTDVLTGILNRQIFEYSLEKAVIQYRRKKSPISLLLIDIDFFKKINDSLGHLAGDQVLIQVTQNISRHIRISDEFSRWGGEEFVILAHDCNHSQAIKIADKIRLSIANSNIAQYPDGSVLTVSIGVSEINEYDSHDSFINRADAALYTAKAEGRNCVRLGA